MISKSRLEATLTFFDFYIAPATAKSPLVFVFVVFCLVAAELLGLRAVNFQALLSLFAVGLFDLRVEIA